MAAMHRELNAAGLHAGPIARFRKDLRRDPLRKVMEREISPYNLPTVAIWLDYEIDGRLEKLLAELEELRQRSREPLKTVGPPLHKLPQREG